MAQNCLSAEEDRYLESLFDLRHDCTGFGPTCQITRAKAKIVSAEYYKASAEEKTKKHKYFNGTSVTFATGISALDPRPDGVARYIDHIKGITVPNPPSHGYYGKLPLIEERDPTCKEIQEAVALQCKNK